MTLGDGSFTIRSRGLLLFALGLWLQIASSSSAAAFTASAKMAPSASASSSISSSTPSFVATSAKGVIFDVDGTLADSWKLGYDATLVVLSNNDVESITEEEYHHHTRYCTPDRLARHAGLEPGHPDFQSVGERLGREFDDLYVDLVDVDTAGFFDGVHELLASIREDVKVGALTNACNKYAHAVLTANCPVRAPAADDDERSDDAAASAVYERFSSIRGADDVPEPKPSPEGLYVCCEDMGVKPADCVYVGDSPSDALAAKNAGMAAVGVMWGSHPEEKLQKAPFDVLCRTIDELREVLPVA